MSLSAEIQSPVLTYTQPLGLFIDGEFVKGVAGKTFDTINPTNEKVIARVHEADPEGTYINFHSFSLPLLPTQLFQMSTLPSKQHAKRSTAFGKRLPLPQEGDC
jgi:hypothetical protein